MVFIHLRGGGGPRLWLGFRGYTRRVALPHVSCCARICVHIYLIFTSFREKQLVGN